MFQKPKRKKKKKKRINFYILYVNLMLLKEARYSTNEPSDTSLTLIYDTFGHEILLIKEKFRYSTSKISVVFYIFIQNSSF